MTTLHSRPWWELVPTAAVDRFAELWRELRQLGRRSRSLLSGAERARLDVVEQLLDELVEDLRPAIAAAAGVPALIADSVEVVRDSRGLQRRYRATLDPMLRRELPAVEAQADEKVGHLADVLGVVAVMKGGAQ